MASRNLIFRTSTTWTLLLFLCGAATWTRADGAPPAPGAAGHDLEAKTPASGPPPFSATSHRRFDDVEHWSRVFDDPSRDAWQKPHDIVNKLGIEPGTAVADLGAGTGYFSRYLATAVGPTGSLFSVEVEPNLVQHLRDRAEQEHTENVTPILASPDNPRLPRSSVDLVLIVDTYHHIDDRLYYFGKLESALKPEGRVAIVEWKAGKLPVGPDPHHKIAKKQLVREMKEAGYTVLREWTTLPYQYFVVFRPDKTANGKDSADPEETTRP